MKAVGAGLFVIPDLVVFTWLASFFFIKFESKFLLRKLRVFCSTMTMNESRYIKLLGCEGTPFLQLIESDNLKGCLCKSSHLKRGFTW